MILIPFKMNKLPIDIAQGGNHGMTRFERQIINSFIHRLCVIFGKFIFYSFEFLPIVFLGKIFRLKISNMIFVSSFKSLLNIVTVGSQEANSKPQFLFKFHITSQCFVNSNFTHNQLLDSLLVRY